MSSFKRFFTGVADTGEKAKDKRLRTRYFRGERRKVCYEIVEFAKRERDLEVVHVSEERGEIMIDYRSPIGFKHDLVVTVFAITPVQSAVDMHAAIRARFFDPGFNAKLISRVYAHLEKRFIPVDDAGGV